MPDSPQTLRFRGTRRLSFSWRVVDSSASGESLRVTVPPEASVPERDFRFSSSSRSSLVDDRIFETLLSSLLFLIRYLFSSVHFIGIQHGELLHWLSCAIQTSFLLSLPWSSSGLICCRMVSICSKLILCFFTDNFAGIYRRQVRS